ncbi:probable asparagine--tRNA ligase, mitochondrial [Cimex lectularius]|uniref:asparagine--tRNA ligase n=1 Tax=Cimex lectularius TaxID=79782 RepID=A0A8I6S0E0_CIMLE|nr:probable asparagine--tRNA ligase, mitochondrial [Cimex lectularius]
MLRLKGKAELFKFCLNSLNKGHRSAFHRIADIKEECKQISIKGWVTSLRKMKEYIFLDLNDGSCSKPLQIVVQKDNKIKALQFGCSIEAEGELVKNKNGQLELKASDVRLIGQCNIDDGYPFAPRKHYSNDYMRQYLHLRLRNNGFAALSRIRGAATTAIHNFFNTHNYINIHTPVLTSNDCEGAGEVFLVEPDYETKKGEKKECFFDNKAFLTVSGQLHLEVAARCFHKVYTFGPTFRAENSKSRLHLSEFYMVEAETALAQSTEDLVHCVGSMFQYVTKYLLENCSEDIYLSRKEIGDKDLTSNLENVVDKPFCIMSYDEVCNVLKGSKKLKTKFVPNMPLTKEQELFIVEHNDKYPVFVIDWPAEIKPFYMKSKDNDENRVMAFDLLCPNVGEVCGGSLREDDYGMLQKKLEDAGMAERLAWYLELRKFGNVLTGGFGLGFERYLQVLLNILNIKDSILFPRWPHNCKM